MSFPKARITRFNEISTCAPPPGKYDPKYDIKVKGAVIEKSKRFADGKTENAPSVASADSASCCSHEYIPASTFRTPQLPRKKIISTPRSAIERPVSRSLKTCSTPDSKTKKRLEYETEKNLVEQINELIRVHSAQLMEKDQELKEKQEEIAELKTLLDKEEKNRIEEYNIMKQKCDKEVAAMKSEMESVVEASSKQKAESEKFISELKEQIDVLSENIKNINALNSDLEYQLAETNITLVEMRNDYDRLEKQLRSTLASYTSLKKERVRFMSQYETIPEQLSALEAASEKTFQRLDEKMNISVMMLKNELEQEYQNSDNLLAFVNSLADDVSDKVDDFKMKLDLLQEGIGNLAITFEQKINDQIEELPKMWNCSEAKLEENLRLVEELEKARASGLEKDILVQDLSSTVEDLRTSLAQMSQHCRKLEIVQGEATKTISVLSQRLYESESDVERLNDKTNELSLRRDALEDKIKALVNENGHLKMKINELQVSIVRDVKEVESALLAKVDSYRRLVANETSKFKREVGEKQKTIEMLMSELNFCRMKSDETEKYLAQLNNKVVQYENDIKELTNNYFVSIEEEYSDKLNAQKVLNIALSNELDEAKKKNAETEERFKFKMADLEGQLLRLRQLDSNAQEQISSLQSAYSNVEQERDALRESATNIKIESDKNLVKIAHLSEEIEQLTRQTSDLQGELALYKERAERSSVQVTKLTKETVDLTQSIKSMTESIVEKDIKLESLTREFEECKRYSEQLTSRIEQLDFSCKRLEQEAEQKSATLVKMSEEDEKLRKLYVEECSKSEELEKCIGEMVSDLMIEKQKCAELEGRLEKQNLQVLTLEETLGDLEKRQTSADSMNEELVSKIVEMKSEKEASELKLVQLEREVERTMKEKEEVVKEKEDVFEIVKRQWDERELMINQMASQEEQIEELKRAKEERYEEDKAIFQAELQNEIFTLQQNLEDTQKRVIDLETRESTLVFQLNSNEAELVASEEERERQESALKDLVEKLASLETKFASIEKRKNEYKMYAKQLETEKTSLKQELEHAAQERERMLEDKKEVSMELTSMAARLADLECRNQESEAKCNILEVRNEEITTKNKELETIIGPFQDQLVAFEKERAELLTKSETAEKELRSLSLEHAKALGHQNNKQKIHRIIQLTENIAHLKKENEKLLQDNNKLRAAAMARKSSSSTSKKDKENFDNGNGQKQEKIKVKLQTSEAEQQQVALSPASPLRTRNAP